jgi:hypothetical protein
MPLSPEAARIVRLGEALFGENWHGQFARMVSLDRSYITRISTDDRPVTQTVAVAVIKGLRTEVERLNAQAAKVKSLSEKYEAAVLTRLLPGK